MNRKKIEKEKKIITSVLMIIFIIMTFFLTQQSKINLVLKKQEKDLNKIKTDASNFYLEKSMDQAKMVATAIKKGFNEKIKNNDIEILIRNEKDEILYRSLEKIKKEIVYYEDKTKKTKIITVFDGKKLYKTEEMKKIKRHDGFYNIYDSEGKKILRKARPVWNRKNMEKILNEMGATSIKMYGDRGDIIVVDPTTGELILDNSLECAATPTVLRLDKKGNVVFRDIFLDHKHENAGYPEAIYWNVRNRMLYKKDGRNIYYFNSRNNSYPLSIIKSQKDWNLKKYPLGEYRREFQFRINIPKEITNEKEDKIRFLILVGIQEPQMVEGSEDIINKYKEIKSNAEEIKFLSLTIPRIMLVLMMVGTIFAMFGLNNAYARILNNT